MTGLSGLQCAFLDALIAATALVNEAVLFTLNKKHFRFIEGLVSMNPYLV